MSVKQFLSILCVAFGLMAFGATMTVAQDMITVSGTVSDVSGPLPGAGVIQQGTTHGVATDMNGRYRLTVPRGSVLEFSSLGYVTQEVRADRQGIDVVLAVDAELIEETVVIGYGVQKKSNVTGAIAQISGESLENRSNEQLGSALQGKMAGVQILTTSGAPGSSSSFRIRGYSSTAASPDPLFLVDGLKVSNTDYLDPESIQSVEVLKDAASAAIYGAQAGNGVVLITTKGGSRSNAKVFYNTLLTAQQPIGMMKMMNARQFKEYWLDLGTFGPDSFQNADTDWQKVVFETGFQQRHTFGIQGGDQKGSFYVSATYLNNDGIVVGKEDVNERVTLQANGTWHVKPWLTIGTTNSIERGRMKTVTDNNFAGTGSVIGGAYYYDPSVPVYYEKDSDAPAALGLDRAISSGMYDIPRTPDGHIYGESLIQNSNMFNPIVMLNWHDKGNSRELEVWRTNVNGTVFADIKPLSGLTITTRVGYRINARFGTGYLGSYYINKDQNDSENGIRSSYSGSQYIQWETYANYLKTFGKHDLAIMAGTEFAKNRTEGLNAYANNVTNTSETYRYLDFYDTAASKRQMGGRYDYRANQSYFSRVAYTYDNRYNLQVSFRADAFGLSKLSKKNRWGYFPSVSAGWTISNERFMADVKDKISFAKLRASWGINGNVNALTDFAWTSSINISSAAYNLEGNGLISSSGPSTVLKNENLTWEQSRQIDVGLDLRFFRDRLTFTVDYFNKFTTGMLTSTSAPLVSGSSSMYVNRGKIQNSGLEFELGWKDQVGKDFSYYLNANLSTVKNKVVESPYGDNVSTAGRQYYVPITYYYPGESMYVIRTNIHKGIDPETGIAQYYTADELSALYPDQYTADGRAIAGDPMPDFTYGFTFGLNWRNWSLSVFGSGVQGNELYLGVYRPDTIGAMALTNMPEFMYSNRWTTSNRTDCTWPRASTQDNKFCTSDFWVFDASYFRIKQVQLGYSLPKSVIAHLGIKGLRAYVSVENLLTITKYPGNNPESMSSTFGSGVGVDHMTYPTTRKYIFGLNLEF